MSEQGNGRRGRKASADSPLPAAPFGVVPEPAVRKRRAAPKPPADPIKSMIEAAISAASPEIAPAPVPELPAPEAKLPLPAPVEAASAPAPEPAAPAAAPAPQPAPPVAAETVTPDTTKTSEPTAPPIGAPIQKGPSMATTFDSARLGGERMQAMFGDMNDRAKGAMEKSAKMAEDMSEFTKGNMEALVASGRVAAKGAESLSHDMAESARKQFETATATMKSFVAAKSPTELLQLQSDFAKTYFDTLVAETSKFSESMLKLAGDVAQPLSSRFAVAAEKIKSPMI